jgi:hypothetical protein
MMIAWAVTWLAMLSIDPNAETRRGTLLVFSKLRAAYSSQRTLHEMYFHHHDEKQLLEKRVRGAMNDLGDRLAKLAVAPTGSIVAKRQKVKTESNSISNFVEEMLSIAKEFYSASLAASQMGRLAFDHTVTITELRSRIAELQTEIRSWVQRSSQDATAAMILAEESVVLARANGELLEHMTKLNERQRKQTETLESLLANSDFGLSTTVLNEILPDGQTHLDLLDLPEIYSRLIGGLRGPVPNDKGVMSILAPTTLATRPDLIDSIERQLRRPLGPEGNLSNAYLNVA